MSAVHHVMTSLQEAYTAYQQHFRESPASFLRDCLEFTPAGDAVPLEEVESAAAIMERFCTGGMSLGAISRETHETIAIAMNRIGGEPACSACTARSPIAMRRITGKPHAEHALACPLARGSIHKSQDTFIICEPIPCDNWSVSQSYNAPSCSGTSRALLHSEQELWHAGKSNSGEGGEDPQRWENLGDVDAQGISPTFPHLKGLQAGDVASSCIKQVSP